MPPITLIFLLSAVYAQTSPLKTSPSCTIGFFNKNAIVPPFLGSNPHQNRYLLNRLITHPQKHSDGRNGTHHTVSMLNGTLKFDTHINHPIDIKRKTIHRISDHSIGIDIGATILIGITAQKTNALTEDGFPQSAIPRLLKELKQYKNFREEDFLFGTLQQNIAYAIRQQAPVHTHQDHGYTNPDPQPPYALAEYRQPDGTLLRVSYTFTSTPSPQELQTALGIIRGSITTLRNGNDNIAPLPQ